jgi:hypothetical protein
MKNEILDQEINDDEQPAELNFGNIVFLKYGMIIHLDMSMKPLCVLLFI